MTYDYKVIQDGVVVARVVGDDERQVEGEIRHYALIYGQDGPVKIRRSNSERATRNSGSF